MTDYSKLSAEDTDKLKRLIEDWNDSFCSAGHDPLDDSYYEGNGNCAQSFQALLEFIAQQRNAAVAEATAWRPIREAPNHYNLLLFGKDTVGNHNYQNGWNEKGNFTVPFAPTHWQFLKPPAEEKA